MAYPIKFPVPKLTDIQFLTAFRTVAKEQSLGEGQFIVKLGLGMTLNLNSVFEEPAELLLVLEQNSELVPAADLHFKLNGVTFSASFIRRPSETTELFTVNVPQTEGFGNISFVPVIAGFRKALKAVDSDAASNFALGEAGRYLEVKEQTLNKLEGIALSVTASVDKYRQQLEAQYDARKNKLEEEYEDQQRRLRETEERLNRRLAEVDDRASKHARRDLRKNLKDEFKLRNEKFELSKGTQGLRTPITILSYLLLGIFGSGFIISSLQSFDIISPPQQEQWILYLRQGIFGTTFGLAVFFFIRWNRSWFEQHANEEFYLKRLDIDLDRASWAVELASEWIDEKDKEIPPVLLERITDNLFHRERKEEVDMHPADYLASAILGASAKAKLKLPNGTEVELDRKSLSQLKKAIVAEEPS